VEVLVLEREAALSIPSHALEGAWVWVVDREGRAHRIQVATGVRTRDRVEILSGLNQGDRVVVAGATLLSEGVLTRVVGG
jgi:multidrug efflux pump subunit AcrA (membrane-fusion protein)